MSVSLGNAKISLRVRNTQPLFNNLAVLLIHLKMYKDLKAPDCCFACLEEVNVIIEMAEWRCGK